MKTIYKYKIPGSTFIGQCFNISIPAEAVLLKVALQDQEICFWYEVESTAPNNVLASFVIYGTGMMIGKHFGEKYIDTVFIDGFVWHIYQVD